LPLAIAAGYTGSARNFRRAVADAKAAWRRRRRCSGRGCRPGEHLVIDWCERDGWLVFCAVLAWWRRRFVRVVRYQKAMTTMRRLAERFLVICRARHGGADARSTCGPEGSVRVSLLQHSAACSQAGRTAEAGEDALHASSGRTNE
jgi:hypothetical protein